jgi:hypothetical protein
MSHLQITIEGAFDDTFYYMGQLIAVRIDRTLVTMNLEEELEQHFRGSVPAILQFFFLHNEWLGKGQVPLFFEIPEVTKGLQAAGRRSEPLALQPEWRLIISTDRSFGRGSILDLQAYRRRLYVSTTEALYDVDFDVEYGELEVYGVRKRLDARCLATSVKYGTVVASCGSEDYLLASMTSVT